jgi:hypothetical protein
MAHRYTPEQIVFLTEKVKGQSNTELIAMFNAHFKVNLSPSQIRAFKKNRGLSSGFDGRFKPGHTPFNKGKKGLNIGGKETQFKKGNKPLNYRPVGSERVNVDGYVEIKISDPGKWRLKHAVIWEEVHGPISKGNCLILLDSNKLNVSLENLQLITRNQLARLNQNHLISNNAELTKTGIIVADIYCKIGARKKTDKE